MAQLGLESLAFSDGSGYVGSLGVYHQLHCLKRIQRWTYRDYYYPNMTAQEESDTFFHMAHCLELLRQATICKADTSITPYRWLHTGKGPSGVEPSPQQGTMHECVNWEMLQEWATERRVDLFDEGLLIRPEPSSNDQER